MNRYSVVLLNLFFFFFPVQTFALQIESMPPALEMLWKNYDRYKESAIKNRLFKHSDLQELLQKHVQKEVLQKRQIGESVQKRAIHHLKAGTGKTKVLLWSQMHGDEATATMALFDLFNFLSANDEFNPLRHTLLNTLELHFVPMLNPDGAQVWARRNAMNIDLNRDARNLATPEAQTLMALAKELSPDFGFNLHDQSTLYAAGKYSPKPATISFLAPAYNTAKEMNAVRTRAVQVIGSINKAIQTKIPGQVAKYNDTHDSTCFGDTFQEMGISTILIESGGHLNDPEKQFIRKINFFGILTALDAISQAAYVNENVADYWALPDNSRSLYDLIIRDVNWTTAGKFQTGDLGINFHTRVSSDYLRMHYQGMLVKTGKLDSVYAYQELNAEGLKATPGKVKKMKRARWEKASPEKELKWLKKGYLHIKWNDENHVAGPLLDRWLNMQRQVSPMEIQPATPANLVLWSRKKPVYAIVNGFLIDLKHPQRLPLNTISY